MKLKAWGCDVDGALDRMMGDECFYLSLLGRAVKDPAFVALGAALEQRDAKKAFEQAHLLKGVLGNMGLTPLYLITCKIVEPLRSGKTRGLTMPYQALMAAHQQLRRMLSEN